MNKEMFEVEAVDGVCEEIEILEENELENIEEKRIYSGIKRMIDILISILAITIFSPIILMIIIMIKLDSKGNAVFGHTRLGKNRIPIKVYKFRTMVENSKEVFANFTEEQKKEYYTNFKLDNDPRITRVGNFLRKTSLDELPQLINVLRGDMSVVGPRPIVEKEVEKYGEYADKFFSVIPGVTGHWQANGRSDTTYEERVQMDMYYINNRSLMLDIKIIFQTVVSVIKKEGAM